MPRDKEKARENARKYRAANPEKVRSAKRESARNWRAANPEKDRENSRKWQASNPKKVREYRAANAEKRRAQSQAWEAANPGQRRASARAWKAANPEKTRAYQRACWAKKQYGLTVTDYRVLLDKPCAICGSQATVLDHCHQTGKIRAGLCSNCNTGIGMLGDSIGRAQAAVAYLAHHGATQPVWDRD